jgi:hypothetical protein
MPRLMPESRAESFWFAYGVRLPFTSRARARIFRRLDLSGELLKHAQQILLYFPRQPGAGSRISRFFTGQEMRLRNQA